MNAAQLSPDTTQGGWSRSLLRIRPLTPSRPQWLDVAFCFALCLLAIWGLRDTFSDSMYLLVGGLGTLLGITLAHLAHALRTPVIVLVALTVVVFFAVGPLAGLRSAPTPTSWRDLAQVSVLGWKDLLTTLPPVDGDGPLLVLPYLLGLLGGALALSVAHRFMAAWAPLPVVLLLLAVVILVGVNEPASLLLQGGVFGLGSLLWVIARGRRSATVVRTGGGRLLRVGTGVVLLAVAAGCAVPLGGVLASDKPRLVLRDRIIPPFDVGQYPSPLAGFRRYRPANGPGTEASRVNNKVLFTVQGADAGTPVRIATLDAYDGMVWGAANVGGSPGEIDDTFQRVSGTIRNPLAVDGKNEDVTITLGEGWRGVWLPTVGAVTGVEFLDDPDGVQAETFRYNLATSTAIVPSGTAPGQEYHLTGVLPDQNLEPGLGSSSFVTVDGSFLATQSSLWAEGVTDPLPRVLAVAEYLKENGGYTDGRAPFQHYGPGHSRGRLITFVAGDQIAGNDEQFASALALMSNQLGVPARVVLGALLPDDGVVEGQDVHAWVEVRVADGTWRTIPTEAFLPEEEPDKNPPRPQTEYAGAVVPPSAPVPPPSTVGDPADGEFDQDVRRRHGDVEDEAAAVPGWVGTVLKWVGPPVGLLLLWVALILGLKARRRHRRRTAAAVTRRFSGGWSEVVDRARDLRLLTPSPGQTRMEEAAVIGVPHAFLLAGAADTHVFGPAEPSEAEAKAYWDGVNQLRADLATGLNPWRKARAALSLISLRRPRRDRKRAQPPPVAPTPEPAAHQPG